MPLPEDDVDLDRFVDALIERLAERVAIDNTRKYLTVAHAAVYADLSEDSIRSMLASGRLRGFRPVSGRVLIDRRELDSVIQSSTKNPRKGRGRYVRSNVQDAKPE